MTTTATPHVIAVSGQIGSGKTTLTRAVAARLGWPAASYGDVVHIEATARGLLPGQYNVPSGKLEDGETALDAVVREAREEIGLT